MTDALSAIARDNEREGKYEAYLRSILGYLKNPADEMYEKLADSAKSVDSVVGGYWGTGSTRLSESLEKKTMLLKKGDQKTWPRFLNEIYETDMYKEAKAISPFSGNDLTFLNYGRGFLIDKHSHGSLLDLVHNEIHRQGNAIFDGGTYAVALPEADLKEIIKLLKGAKIHSIRD
jgi:hypothetical protein